MATGLLGFAVAKIRRGKGAKSMPGPVCSDLYARWSFPTENNARGHADVVLPVVQAIVKLRQQIVNLGNANRQMRAGINVQPAANGHGKTIAGI